MTKEEKKPEEETAAEKTAEEPKTKEPPREESPVEKPSPPVGETKNATPDEPEKKKESEELNTPT